MADGHKDDRNGPGSVLRRHCTGIRRDHDDVYLEPDQLGQETREKFGPPLRPAIVDSDLLALHVAQLAEALAERIEEMPVHRVRACLEKSHPIEFPRLLGLGRERHRDEADSENDREPDQPHGHLGGGRLAGSLADLNYWRCVWAPTTG